MSNLNPQPASERIILGIDPGTTIMGYGVIRCRGKAQVELVEMGALHMSKIKDHALKLKRIYDRVSALIDTHAPDELAVEAPFFGQNVQSMLKLGRAQGVALAAALAKEIPVAEYAPRRVKQAVTEAEPRPRSKWREWCGGRCRSPSKTCPRIWMRPMGWLWRCATITSWPRPKCSVGGGWKGFLADNPERVRKG